MIGACVVKGGAGACVVDVDFVQAYEVEGPDTVKCICGAFCTCTMLSTIGW